MPHQLDAGKVKNELKKAAGKLAPGRRDIGKFRSMLLAYKGSVLGAASMRLDKALQEYEKKTVKLFASENPGQMVRAYPEWLAAAKEWFDAHKAWAAEGVKHNNVVKDPQKMKYFRPGVDYTEILRSFHEATTGTMKAMDELMKSLASPPKSTPAAAAAAPGRAAPAGGATPRSAGTRPRGAGAASPAGT